MGVQSIYRTEHGRNRVMALYDSVLQRWPVVASTRTVETRHGDTCVISSGSESAPPLILLHGAASNATSWVGEITAYADSFRVHAVDLPGEPGRSAPNRISLEGPGYAEWLEDVLDGLGIDECLLLGLSHGGWVAMRFATVFPGRVQRLVLLAPGGIVRTRTSFLLKAMLYLPFGQAGARRINRLVIGNMPLHEAAVRAMDLIMANFNSRMDREYLFTDEELGNLSMPVQLIEGAHDAIFPARAAVSRLCRCAPRVESHVLPDSGHCLVEMAGRTIPFLMRSPAVVESLNQ